MNLKLDGGKEASNTVSTESPYVGGPITVTENQIVPKKQKTTDDRFASIIPQKGTPSFW